jgi:amino acid transporter
MCNIDSPTDWIVRGIAIGIITSACLLHGAWRAGGIYVNNILAMVKLGILILIIIVGFVAYRGVFHDVEKNSFQSGKVFESSNVSGYAGSTLAVLFSYGGFDNANYVSFKIPAF